MDDAKADIYTDDQGRRRVDRAHSHDNPEADPAAALAGNMAAMEARLAKSESEVTALRTALAAFTITAGSASVQVSGAGPKSIVISVVAGDSGGIGGTFNNFEMCDGSVWALLGYQVSAPP